MNLFFILIQKALSKLLPAIPCAVLATLMLFITSTSGAQMSSASLTHFASVGQFVFIDIDSNGKRDGNDIPLSNVTINLYDSSNNILATRVSDVNGHFLFDSIKVSSTGVSSFKLKFESPSADYKLTSQINNTSDSAISSIANPATGFSSIFTLQAGEARLNLNAGFRPGTGVSLPATINQFTGGYANGFVELSWRSLLNATIKQFDIERSTDGTNFRQIGQVLLDEENSNNGKFTYLDILAEKGANFYRLVLVDKEGNYSYSKVLTISVEAKGISLMVVYPNPFSKKVQVKIESDNAEPVSIRVIDNSGNVVRMQAANLQKGDNRIAILNVDNLPSGLYFLEVVAKDRKMRIRLMKQQ